MSNPLDEFHTALAKHHLHAGRPSSREIEKRLGGVITRTPIAAAFRFDQLPTAKTLFLLLKGLGVNKDPAEVERMCELWQAARDHKVSMETPLDRGSLRQELDAIHAKLDEILKRLPDQ